MRSLWKGLTPFATHLTLKYALRMGTNAFYQSLLRDQVGDHEIPARILFAVVVIGDHSARQQSTAPSKNCRDAVAIHSMRTVDSHAVSRCVMLSESKCHEDGASHVQDGLLKDNRRMAAGFMAGVTEALVIVTPFEVVKIRLQQQRGLSKNLLKYKVCNMLYVPCAVKLGTAREDQGAVAYLCT